MGGGGIARWGEQRGVGLGVVVGGEGEEAREGVSAKAISEKISEKTSEKFTVTDRTIESDLAHLKKIGILTREGGRKDGKWVIVIENKEAT